MIQGTGSSDGGRVGCLLHCLQQACFHWCVMEGVVGGSIMHMQLKVSFAFLQLSQCILPCSPWRLPADFLGRTLASLCRVAFIPFLVACDPDAGTTVKALQKLDEVGWL